MLIDNFPVPKHNFWEITVEFGGKSTCIVSWTRGGADWSHLHYGRFISAATSSRAHWTDRWCACYLVWKRNPARTRSRPYSLAATHSRYILSPDWGTALAFPAYWFFLYLKKKKRFNSDRITPIETGPKNMMINIHRNINLICDWPCIVIRCG